MVGGGVSAWMSSWAYGAKRELYIFVSAEVFSRVLALYSFSLSSCSLVWGGRMQFAGARDGGSCAGEGGQWQYQVFL